MRNFIKSLDICVATTANLITWIFWRIFHFTQMFIVRKKYATDSWKKNISENIFLLFFYFILLYLPQFNKTAGNNKVYIATVKSSNLAIIAIWKYLLLVRYYKNVQQILQQLSINDPQKSCFKEVAFFSL